MTTALDSSSADLTAAKARLATAMANPSTSTANPGLTSVIAPDGSVINVAGDPSTLETQPAPAVAPTSTAPSKVSQTLQTAGTIASGIQLAGLAASSLLNGAMKAGTLGSTASTAAGWIYTIANNPIFAGALAGLSAYSVYSGISSMLKNGYTTSGLISTSISSLGLVAGIHTLLIALGATGPVGWIVGLGALAVVALFSLLFGSHPNQTPSAEEQPLIDFPSVWTSSGTALYITAGTALMTMGFNMTPTAPLTQQIVVPTVAMSTTLGNSGLVDVNGNPVGSYSKYNTLFVEKGDGVTTPDRVLIVSPGTAGGTDAVSVYTIKKNLQFSSPSTPNGAYIPILISDGKGNMIPNPQAVQAMNAESALAGSASSLSGSSGISALQNAGATNKLGQVSSGSN